MYFSSLILILLPISLASYDMPGPPDSVRHRLLFFWTEMETPMSKTKDYLGQWDENNEFWVLMKGSGTWKQFGNNSFAEPDARHAVCVELIDSTGETCGRSFWQTVKKDENGAWALVGED